MSIINSIFGYFIKKRVNQIEFFLKYPHQVQEDWFGTLIDASASTEWGRQYDYRSIHSVDTFRDRVPIQTYDSIKPQIDRIIAGEQNVLWPSEIKMFAKSSGTTSAKSKFIPVSQECLEECHYKGGKDLMALYYHQFPDSKLMDGRSLVMGGSSDFIPLNKESYYGDLSAIIIKNLPFWAQLHRTPEAEVSLIPAWEEKIERITRITIDQNITSISGVPSWMLVLLKNVLKNTGKSSILEVWPNLEWYVHGGVSFAPYELVFRQVMGGAINYSETYNASEGFFGIRDRCDRSDMLLMLDYGIFYEFMPLDQLGQQHPKTLLLSEVEAGVHYALVITTNSGLWRYLIGDTIVFTELDPYRIKVSGRTKQFLNTFGEEVIVENAERALKQACDELECRVVEFTVAPIFMKEGKAGAHEWLIEFQTEPESLAQFAQVLDNALKAINSDYEAKRYRDMALRPPVIRSLPKDSFFKWMKAKGKLGGQHKVPRLSNTRAYLEEILEHAK